MSKLNFRISGLALICAVMVSAVSQAAGERVPATLWKITDGDTVLLHDEDGKQMKIRYLGMDAPEQHFQNQSQDPWGGQATDHLHKLMNATEAKLAKNGQVIKPCKDIATGKPIEVEVELAGKDRYKRDLGYVHFGKTNTNLQMTLDGWALPYLYCTDGICDKDWFKDAYVEDYINACKAARKAKLGIFDPANTMKETPSQFRRRIGHTPAYQFIGDYDSKKLYKPEDDKKVDPCVVIRFQNEDDALTLGYSY